MATQEVARAMCHSALLCRGAPRPHRVLLDGGGVDSWGDGTALYTDSPVATLTAYPSGWARWQVDDGIRWQWGDPLRAWQSFLDAALAAFPAAAGGVVTVLGYDLKHIIERLPRRQSWLPQPVLFAARYDWAYRADWRRGRATISADGPARLDAQLAWYERAAPPTASSTAPRRLCPQWAIGEAAYHAMLARAHEYITAGDVYQVNLAQPLRASARRADAAALVAAWSERYPMPYAAYVDGGDFTVVSNSPECLLQIDGDRIATFPIKGTRGHDAEASAAAALSADQKERAEHLMIVDLERNDLGRVCTPGSVAVAPLFALRDYPLLTHMWSGVSGRLRAETTLADVLRATFPGGSITGAPKVRAMQIIDELEPAPRGFYTGAIGWTDRSGRTTFNIAIRTATFTADRELTYWAGGGIVADSQADREYAETLLKTETLVRALASLNGGAA